MKRSILGLLILTLLITTGCTMDINNTSNNQNLTEDSIDVNSLIGTNLINIQNTYGSPYSATYYIDIDKVSANDISALSKDTLNDSINEVATFKYNSKNNLYLHVYCEGGIIKNAVSGDYSLKSSEEFLSKEDLSNSDYKVQYFKDKGMICENDFSINYASKTFAGKSIDEFNKAYSLSSANLIGSTMNDNEAIYLYPLVPHTLHPDKNHQYPNYSSNSKAKLDTVNPVNNNLSNTNKTDNKDLSNYSKSSVIVYTKDNKINSISVEGKDFIYEMIQKVLQNGKNI